MSDKLTILGEGHTDATYCPKCWDEGSHDHWLPNPVAVAVREAEAGYQGRALGRWLRS